MESLENGEKKEKERERERKSEKSLDFSEIDLNCI